jgi:DNA-binding transcriptional LysR family regulator
MPGKHIDLNRLMIFREVVLAGSFSKAATKLKQPKSRISRNLAALEKDLGLQLIYRTTRQFQLTSAGQELMQKTMPLLGELERTMDSITSSAEEVAGLLRLSVPDDIGTELMGGICHSFMELYPKITIDLQVSNAMVDVVRESFDMALRIGKLKDSSLIQKRIGHINLTPYIAPSLLHRLGPKIRLEDLEQLPYLSFSPLPQSLKLSNGKETRSIRVKPLFTSNNLFVLRSLAIQGHGFAALPPFLASEAVSKNQLLPAVKGWCLEGSPVQIVIPQQIEIPLRTKKFMEHLAEHLSSVI